jgi:RNA polymerase sigma-70 factor (ECF subfamily)
MSPKMEDLIGLMERYARGDEQVFEPLYHSLSPRLYRFCRRLALSAPEADDLFQETFLKLHRARATYIAGADVLHWAFAIARSIYLTRLRYWRRRPEELGTTHDAAERAELWAEYHATPEGEALAEHLLELAVNELARMSEKNRTAYILLKTEGLSAKEAAAILGTTPVVVKQRAHRAYEQLRAVLNADGRREPRGEV